MLVLGLWLGCSAMHTGVAFGQLSVVVVALMLPALGPWGGRDFRGAGEAWPWRSWRTAGCGLMLAVAGALKPQLVVVFAVLLLATPRWRVAVWSLAWGTAIAVGALAWVQTVAPTWLTHWGEQLEFFAQSGLASPTAANEFTYQMINLEPWLHRLWSDGIGMDVVWQRIAVGLPTLMLFALGVFVLWHAPRSVAIANPGWTRSRWETDDFLLLALAMGGSLSLLATYHRTYDAVLLVWAGLWVWRRLSRHRGDLAAWVVAFCLLTFLLPGPALLVTLDRRGVVPDGLADSWLWRAWLLPHQNVALVVMTLAMGYRLLRGGGRTELPIRKKVDASP